MSENPEHGFDPHGESSVFSARGTVLRRLAWTAGVVGQLVGVMVQAAAPLQALGRAQRNDGEMRGKGNASRASSHFDPLPPQLKILIGRSKKQIAARLGPPSAAFLQPAVISVPHPVATVPPDFLQTDTWYYRFNTQDHSAIAITFRNGYARRVEYIALPM